MSDRREFSRAVRVVIIKRSTRNGVVYCEKCGLPAKQWAIDHIDPDGLQIDKSRKLTATDGQLLCSGSRDTCHGRKTAEQDVPNIAEAKRREAAHLNAKAPPAKPIASRGFARVSKTKAPLRVAAGEPAMVRRYR